jgi:hypothetical protein
MGNVDRATAEALERVAKTAEVLGDDDLLCEICAIEEKIAAGVAAGRQPMVPFNAVVQSALWDALDARKRLTKLDAALESMLTAKLKSNADKRAEAKRTKAAQEKQAIADKAQRAAEKLEQVRLAAAARLKRD